MMLLNRCCCTCCITHLHVFFCMSHVYLQCFWGTFTHTHQWTGTEVWGHVPYFCLFECEELQNSTFFYRHIERKLLSVIGVSQLRRLFRSEDSKTNVQAKPISWCFNLCNLNIKFDSSDVIKKVGRYRSCLTLYPSLRNALSEPVVWQWSRGLKGSQNSTLRFGLSGWRRDWNRFLKLNKSSCWTGVCINTRTQNKKSGFHT